VSEQRISEGEVVVVKTLAAEGAISEDARKFAEEQGILAYVEKAMAATRVVYSDGEPITAVLTREQVPGTTSCKFQC
jgi:hypothetical protein